MLRRAALRRRIRKRVEGVCRILRGNRGAIADMFKFTVSMRFPHCGDIESISAYMFFYLLISYFPDWQGNNGSRPWRIFLVSFTVLEQSRMYILR